MPRYLSRLFVHFIASCVVSSEDSRPCGCGDALQAEIEAIRSDMPKYILRIGEPYAARQIIKNQQLRLNKGGNGTCEGAKGSGREDSWPWRLKVDIAVSKGPFRKEHRVIMEFPSTYPARLPTIRFGSKLGHAYFSELEQAHSSIPTDPFYSALSREAVVKGKVSLSLVLKVLNRALTKPLENADKAIWKQQADAFKESTDVVTRYRKKRKHARLFTIGGFVTNDFPDPVDSGLRAALANISGWTDREEAKAALLASGVLVEVIAGMVYSFKVFTSEFCDILMDEVRNFHATGLPARRPNSMNNYGIILNEIGMEPLMFAIQDEVIQPMSAVLFPKDGSELESHHAFTVRYKRGEDSHLDVHTDDSDVTFNVNIFGDYEGCPLVFCGIVGSPDHRHFKKEYMHRVGFAVMHRGQHRHGAEDITTGERVNLIVWSYSYNFRMSAASKKKHKREKAPPDRRCVSYTHDRDYGRFKEYPPGKRAQFEGRGWCPQRGKEYSGFIPDVPDSKVRGRGGFYDDDDEEL